MSRDMSALIGVVGDFNPKNPTHRFTNEALDHLRLPFQVVPTDALEAGGLRVSGLGGAGEVRIVEIPDHPFFLATLFLPQSRSTPSRPHPLLAGFAAAATAHREARVAS